MYTRGGDKGETSLYGAKRVPKDSARVEAYGTIDELNSCIGVAISKSNHDEIVVPLKQIQRLLFVAGADMATELAGTGDRVPRVTKANTDDLEKKIDDLQRQLPKLTRFILPGGTEVAAQLHVARSVCRRAERRILSASRVDLVNPELIPFFNRLSTYFFNLARLANVKGGRGDELWEG